MNTEYIQKGETLDYKNEGTENITLGQIVVQGSRTFVAADNIPVGAVGTLAAEGVFSMEKAAGEAIGMGDKVYYDAANDCITTTAKDNTEAGYAVESAKGAAGTVKVKIG